MKIRKDGRRWPATTTKSKLTPLSKMTCRRRTKVLQRWTHQRERAARLLTPYLTAGARAKNRFLKLIGTTGTRFSRGKRNDNSAVFLPAQMYCCSYKSMDFCSGVPGS